MRFRKEVIMQSYSRIREFIEENDVEFIRLAYFDVFGTQKNIAIMSGELERAMKYGISIDGAAIAGFDADIRSDLFLKPDPSTISIVPWRHTLYAGESNAGSSFQGYRSEIRSGNRVLCIPAG